jgi:hypothetical protein
MTWAEFKAAVKVLLTTDANRAGATSYVDALIRLGITDLQHFIKAMRTGFITVYYPEDLDTAGETSFGNMPGAVTVTSMYMTKSGHTCCRVPYLPYPGGWEHRFDLTCQSAGLKDHNWSVFDPFGETFGVYPALEEGYEVEMVWDGVRLGWDDEDTMPTAYTDERVALAVAEFVKARVAREVKNDMNMAGSYQQSYNALRQQLYLYFGSIGITPQTTSPNSTSTCSACAGGCEDVADDTSSCSSAS